MPIDDPNIDHRIQAMLYADANGQTTVRVGGQLSNPKTDDNNSSTLALNAGITFDGSSTDTQGYGVIIVSVHSDVASATDGLKIQFSHDGIDFDHFEDVFTIVANASKTFSFQPVARYFRVKYVNGGADQTEFILQTQLKAVYVKPSSHRVQDAIVDDDDGELVKAVITGKRVDGTYDNVNLTNGNNMKVSLEEFESGISSNSNSQLNVTPFDSSGVEIVAATSDKQDALLTELQLKADLTETQPINNTNDYFNSVTLGLVSGATIVNAMGERESMGTTTTGEDIWRGSADEIPLPPDVGEQMTVVSSNNSDGAGADTGVRTVRIEYIDAAGDAQTEDITMNGTSGVNTVATDIRFVNDMYSLTVGSNGVAEGSITIYQTGSSSTVYNLIYVGGNKSMVPNRMVPAGKTLILKGWHAEEAQGKRVNVRIRSTDMNGVLIPRVFCFKDTSYINKSNTSDIRMNIKVPSLSIIKVSGWPDAGGAEVGCGWWGVLVDD